MIPFPKYNEKGELDTRLTIDPITGYVGIGTPKEKEHMTKDEAIILLCEHFSEGMVRTIVDAIAKNEALETKDEPVAWEQFYPDIGKPQIAFNAEVVGYVAPQRTWVGLTDEEKAQFVVAYYPSNWDRKTAVSLMNDYEKYLKEKNNV